MVSALGKINARKKKPNVNSFTPQPTSESNPAKQQTTRDDGRTAQNQKIVRPSPSSNKPKSPGIPLTPSGGAIAGIARTGVGADVQNVVEANRRVETTFEDTAKGTPLAPITPAGGAKAIQTTNQAINAASAVKKVGTIESITSASSTAKAFASNTKTVAQTSNWIKKLGGASTLVAIIGSYPFSGFIKEEALQTLSFATKTAVENGDIEGAEKALAEQAELLDPTVMQKIIASVPFVNVANQLKNFFNAARTKMSVDEQRIEDMKEQQGGKSEDEIWEDRFREQEARRQWAADEKIANQANANKLFDERQATTARIKAEGDAAEIAARIADNKEFDARLKKQRRETLKFDEERRKAENDFWDEYWAAKDAESSSRSPESSNSYEPPSKLGFGLL